MAKAVKQEQELEVRTVVTQEEAVVLTLSIKEAQTVADVLLMVGGCPMGSRRKYADHVRQALACAGISSEYTHITSYQPSDVDYESSIYFKDSLDV
jgi:hypothetical protein